MKRITTDIVKNTMPQLVIDNIDKYYEAKELTGSHIYLPNTRLTQDVKNNINVNIWVIRNSQRRAGKFDDLQIVFWKDCLTGEWVYDMYNVTCDPSDLALEQMKNPNGTAVLSYGFHKSKWKLGFHKGRLDHPALVQVKPLLVYRDNNKDKMIDIPNFDNITLMQDILINGKKASNTIERHINSLYDFTLVEEFIDTPRMIIFTDRITNRKYKFEVGQFGINNHRASSIKVLDEVGLYSEGCIVHQDPERYLDYIDILKRSAKLYGDSFSITVVPDTMFYR